MLFSVERRVEPCSIIFLFWPFLMAEAMYTRCFLFFQVAGYCKDESNPEIFDRVDVRGDIRFSDIHHNWFGL